MLNIKKYQRKIYYKLNTLMESRNIKNTGCFVFKPHQHTYHILIDMNSQANLLTRKARGPS